MKCQILLAEKNWKNILNLLSAELAQSMVKVKYLNDLTRSLSFLLLKFEKVQFSSS